MTERRQDLLNDSASGVVSTGLESRGTGTY